MKFSGFLVALTALFVIATGAPAHAAGPSSSARPGWALRTLDLDRGRPGSPAVHYTTFETSANWAGYVFKGTTFTGVSGQWTVPAVTPAASGRSASWLGVDGYDNATVVQTGTDQRTDNGQNSYFAWAELYPNPPVTIGDVSPGDVMQASVEQTSPGTWTVSIDDLTCGSSCTFTGSASFSSPGDSAEWILEDGPSGSDGIPTLADFGTLHFHNLGVSGPNLAAGSAVADAITDSGGQIIAYPTSFDSANGSFDVDYGAPPEGGTTPAPSTPSQPAPTTSTVPAPSSPTPSGPLAPRACAAPVSGVASAPPTSMAAFEQPDGCAGYWIATADGHVAAFSAPSLGDWPEPHAPVIAIAPTPTGQGYWLVAADGSVKALGDAVPYGDLAGRHLNGSIIAAAATSSGHGYWLVGSDGGIFTFGDAGFFGSTGNLRLNQPVVGIAPAPGGQGYWLVAADGGIFSFGAAPFLGSMGATRLNRAVIGMTADPAGRGYRMVASDGGVFSFGAPFYGSLGAAPPPSPVITMAPSSDGNGYYLLTASGAVYSLGDAPYEGGL
jgi:hypothetical protein